MRDIERKIDRFLGEGEPSSGPLAESVAVVDGHPPLPEEMTSAEDAEMAVEFFRSVQDDLDDLGVGGGAFASASRLSEYFQDVAAEFYRDPKFGPSIPGRTIDLIADKLMDVFEGLRNVEGYDERAFERWQDEIISDLENYRR